ncbi:hypothetical protein OROHE_000939 [Orobanche hederae]
MNIFKSTFISYISLISLVSVSRCNPSAADGFTTDLIHRDSPESPTYDPSLSPPQRLANAIRRSSRRIRRFKMKHTRESPISDMTNSDGEYLMKYSIGTPPVPSLGVADTGSDIIWTQCQPCLQCFNQNLTFFAPKKSSTYKRIPCNTSNCKSLTETSCSKTRNNCLYYEMYGDGSFTNGLLANETLTLTSATGTKVVSLPNITFGCGFRNGGIFDGGESGIVGLGGGHASLVRQLGSIARGKFSYCLVSSSGESNTSKLHFGGNAVVSGEKVVATPLVRKKPKTFYFLTLEGISVGTKRLDYYDDEPWSSVNSGARGEGNIIIDSGTTLTLLPSNLYRKLEKEMNGSITLERTRDPLGALELCYFTREDHIKHPPVTFHFKDADVKLKEENIFVRTSNVSLCLAAQPVMLGLGIYGNLAQINFLVGYDLEKRTVSFKPTHCGRE